MVFGKETLSRQEIFKVISLMVGFINIQNTSLGNDFLSIKTRHAAGLFSWTPILINSIIS